MQRVTGIGGIFSVRRDPEVLAQWYQDHLGIKLTPESYDEEPWYQEAGATVLRRLNRTPITSAERNNSG